MKKLNYYELEDNDNTYGIVVTEIEEREFLKLLEKYKKEDEDYNNLDFVSYLNKDGEKARLIEPIRVYF